MNVIALTIAAFAVHMMVGCDRSASETNPSTSEGSGPLAYTVHKADGVSLATFNDWETTASADDKGTTIRSSPRGRKTEFTLILYIAPMNAQDQATYLDETPTAFARAIPGMEPKGAPQTTTIGGSDARLMEYDVTGAAVPAVMPGAIGGNHVARAAFVRKNDVGVMAFAAGTPEAMAELGRAVDIAAENVTFTESPLEEALVGRWYNTGSTSSSAGPNMFSITWERTTTFQPDGSFRETDLTIGSSGSGGLDSTRVKTGHVIRRGGNLTFHYDDGSVRTSDYTLQGDSLQLHGKRWERR